MKNLPTSLILIIFFVFFGFTQENKAKKFIGEFIKNEKALKKVSKLKENTQVKYSQAFTEFSVFEINTHTLVDYLKLGLKSQEQTLDVNLILGDQYNFSITLRKHNLRAENYKLQRKTATGHVSLPNNEIHTYRGFSTYSREQKVILTLAPDFISGYIQQGKDYFYIEPARKFDETAPKNHYIVYNANKALGVPNAICNQGNEEIGKNKLKDAGSTENYKYSKVTRCTEFAVAFDQSFKSLLGGTANAEATITARLNLVSDFYVEKFNIEYKLVTIVECGFDEFISDNVTESCQQSGNGCQDGTVLKEFADWGNSGGLNAEYDVATFWTNRNLKDGNSTGNIGYSFFSGICNSKGYNIVEDYFSTGNNAHATIWIHELGHTWSAYHVGNNATDMMSPNLYGNNSSAPTNRNVTSSTSNSIINFRNSCNCLDSGCVNSLPPNAFFDADVSSGCQTLTVNFTDLSANDPVAWSWDFGDGYTSTSQNPTHTFYASSSGEYLVSLVSTNSNGSSTPFNKAIYVEEGVEYPSENVGPIDNNFGDGGYYNIPQYLIFDVIEDVRLNSVKVYAESAGSRTFKLQNSSGDVLESKSINLQPGENRVNFNWSIESGSNYRLYYAGDGSTGLYRNKATGVASFPYTHSSNLVVIKCQDYDQDNCDDFYYFFYDWKVQALGCNTALSVSQPVFENINIYPNPVDEVLNLYLKSEMDLSYVIYNSIGATIIEIDSITGNTIKLNALSSGMYFIKFINKGTNEFSIFKIIKK